jgi:hypothetical protein
MCRLFVQLMKYQLKFLNYYFKKQPEQELVDPISKVQRFFFFLFIFKRLIYFQVCLCMNNIEYIKTQTLSVLPTLLKYDQIANDLEQAYNTDMSLKKNTKLVPVFADLLLLIRFDNYWLHFKRDTLEKSIFESIKDIDILTHSILNDMSGYFIPIMRSKVILFFDKKNVS